MSIDVAAARAATPGCANWYAHLHNAGSALPTARTLEVVIDHLRLEAEVGGYAAQDRVADRLEAVRSSAARLLGAHRDEVAITTSDTAAFVKALWGFVLGGGLPVGGRVAVDRLQYDSHYIALLQLQRVHGVSIEVLPVRPDGPTDVDAAVARLREEPPDLLSLTLIGTNNGLVNDVAPLGRAARELGVPVFVDGCQAVGQLPLDVEALSCDVLTGTGRKFLRAPRGTGLLYVRRTMVDRLEPPGIDGHSARWVAPDRYDPSPTATRCEEFEGPIAAHLGLGAAIDQALELGLEEIWARLSTLGDELRARLAAKPAVTVHDGDGARCAIVTFSVAGHEPIEVVRRAGRAGVTIGVSNAPAALLDMTARGLGSVVRASPHYFNDDDDLDRLVAALP